MWTRAWLQRPVAPGASDLPINDGTHLMKTEETSQVNQRQGGLQPLHGHSLSHSGQSRLSPDSRSRLGTRGPTSPPHRKSSHLSVYWKEVQGDSTSAQMTGSVTG